MSEQKKFERQLRVLILLSGNFSYTRKEIAEKLQISLRTVYRYLETLEDVGFVINDDNGYVKIDKNEGPIKNLDDLLHFSEEEAWILSKAIHSIDDNTVLKSNLVKKLYALYDFKRVANAIVKKELSENVHQIITAIKNKKQIKLLNYHSAHSDEIKTRLVEPYDFTTGYVNVWCYEPQSAQNKVFKLSRIGKVEITDTDWIFEKKHNAGHLDIFRISSYQKIPVKLLLSLRARNLLIEEYPLSEKYIHKLENGKYLFENWVAGYEGISRFVLGLSDEIVVLEPMALKKYLNNKIINKIF
jgi:predicted DNA-binding transcriptional regulator YafY